MRKKSNTRLRIKQQQTPELAYDCFRTVMPLQTKMTIPFVNDLSVYNYQSSSITIHVAQLYRNLTPKLMARVQIQWKDFFVKFK